MHALYTLVHTLAEHATPSTTLLAIDLGGLRRYPENTRLELARQDQLALRLLERSTRLTLSHGDRTRYHAHEPADCRWAILLPPRGAAARIYLARTDQRRLYCPGPKIAAPAPLPATVCAQWNDVTHSFTHVTGDEQLNLVLFYSTAHSVLYIPPDAPATNSAHRYSSESAR